MVVVLLGIAGWVFGMPVPGCCELIFLFHLLHSPVGCLVALSGGRSCGPEMQVCLQSFSLGAKSLESWLEEMFVQTGV